MNTKMITGLVVVAGVAAAAGVYALFAQQQSNKEEATTMSTETTVLNIAKDLYFDVLADNKDATVRSEKIKELLVTLIYTHITTMDCTQGENRTYVNWLRKMSLPNPEHYEAIIRRCADEGISNLGPIREVVLTHRSGSMFITKQQHEIEVADLSNYTSLEDITSNKLDIPTDAYALSVERILDIPVKVVLTGRQNVVTLKEAV